MLINVQMILGRFLKLNLPRFFGAPSGDAYKFIVSYEDRLYNLGLVETHDVYYTTFQLDLVAQQWCRGHLDSKPARSSFFTLTQFSKVSWRSASLIALEITYVNSSRDWRMGPYILWSMSLYLIIFPGMSNLFCRSSMSKFSVLFRD